MADPNPADPNNSVWDSGTSYFFTGTGADWIWENYRTVNPISGDIVYFEKTFNIPGDPTSGTLHITCDNGYEVYLKGMLVGSAQLGAGWETSNLTQVYVDTNNWKSIESYDVLTKLVPGTNVLLIKAANEYMGTLDSQNNGTTDTNPAGLIFELDIDYEEEEPCYEFFDETAWADGDRYVQRGNWATFTTYTGEAITETLFAGKTIDVGTVEFSAVDNDKVTITITLSGGWEFAPEDENVKIQDYAVAPSGNPAPGLFYHKGDAIVSPFSIVVPKNDFYGVHVDVGYWEEVECPEEE